MLVLDISNRTERFPIILDNKKDNFKQLQVRKDNYYAKHTF